MIYKVKNISNEPFIFEGLTLAPGAESHELTPEVYQRLLALYLNTSLAPVDSSTFDSKEPEAGPETTPETAPEATPETAPETAPEKVDEPVAGPEVETDETPADEPAGEAEPEEKTDTE